MRFTQLNSLSELRENSQRWDDLWWRSNVTTPTVRAELLAQWVEHFTASRQFIVLAVEDQGDFVAALPLASGARVLGSLPCGQVPRNCWADCGEFLLDPGAEVKAVFDRLVDGLKKLPWGVICADGIDVQSSQWKPLLDRLQSEGLPTYTRPWWHVGLIDIGSDWEQYERSLSGNHRRSIHKALRRLGAEKRVELKRCNHLSRQDVDKLLRRFCEIENESWKGEAGSSIQKSPGMFEFYRRQAEQLADWGQVEFQFLEHDDRLLAAEYGFAAKGVYFSNKIAYAPRYANVGPGKLLRYHQLKQYFEQDDYHVLDTLGILSDSNAKWATRSYTSSGLLMSTGSVLGNTVVCSYKRVLPIVKKLVGRSTGALPSPNLGAARYMTTNPVHEKAVEPHPA